MPTTTLDADQLTDYVHQAVELSLANVHDGGVPFAALVVDPEHGIVGSGVNRVMADRDPLAHAEVVALRDACGSRNRFRPAGCVLIASGEPCALCYTSALYSNITHVVSAVDRHEAARNGFNYLDSYDLFAKPPEKWQGLSTRHWSVDNALTPFTAWRELHMGDQAPERRWK
ncbi:tRNA(Arg) A34 adenosine deaminase TadA [Actinopolyspora lacussalsi]|uniref:tRNA(Arg) A34 adenosine deaminase TadA n=1 Tax=Actinopolyspora righensis TaxID=995060 RepID=A0A1I7BYW5_9ACTN|nr:nucleoside deaminase [Actinopolyspora righensis]MDP9643156.1 tRNA(Arg) A34 adenosine deaminase TadA [Actinopolyspora lacussalsi]SFT92366.1 tRNA(Arg) A34 adenosine deaminase TadA [Actinopolyspora righensis]